MGPNGTTITLNDPDKSNQPKQSTAKKPNDSTEKAVNNIDKQGNNLNTKNTGNNTSEETNNLNTQMQQQIKMMQQMIDGQKEAKESLETLKKMRQDILNIKHTNNEIRENINLTTAKADEALLRSTEATEQAAENKLRINKLETDITTIKTIQNEASTENDEALEEMATIKQDVTQAKKDINPVNNKIDGLQTTMETIETINREMAAKLATNISMDNPETADQQNTTRNPMLPFQRQQMIREEEQHQRAKYIMDIARKRVGLKPITANHISAKAGKQIQITDINNQHNAYYRKMAAHEFLEQELKVNNAVITSSKLSTTSDILWVQLDNEKSAIDIQKQSATLRREARAIMYPPPEFFRTIKSVEHNCNERKKTDKDLRYMVKLGTDNIELWTKYLREPQYSLQPLTTFGKIEPPNIQRIIITPNFGQSPPKGRGKPHNYSTLQQQTPQGIEQEKTSETEPTQHTSQGQNEVATNHNIPQATTGEIATEETPNLNPKMQPEAENKTP